jgi:ABC-2 type transport system ATP-binding protein
MTVNVIEACELGRRYGSVWGLYDATFEVSRGRIAVLLGPNGAGKTTTINILATILRPSKGYASVLGYDVVDGYRYIRKMVAYLPQDCRGDNNWTPYEAVKWFLVARGFTLSDASLRAKEWIEYMGLGDCRDVSMWRLSGGQSKRVLVSMVLATGAELIFLDEPTTGLDVEAKYVIWRKLREYVRDGSTILLTTHDMREAEILGDYIIMVHRGRTVAKGRLSDLRKFSQYEYRVVLDKYTCDIRDVGSSIDLGDKKIIYARNREELDAIISGIDINGVIKIEKTGLEDIYLNVVRMGRE